MPAAGSLAVRSRRISSCWAAIRARAWLRKSVSPWIVELAWARLFFSLLDLRLEAFDLCGFRVRGFSCLLQLLEAVLEFGA